jgi:hypothetical protein
VETSELTKLAAMMVRKADVAMVAAILAQGASGRRSEFAGRSRCATPEGAVPLDIVLITDIIKPQDAYDSLSALRPDLPIPLPPMLNVSPRAGEVE